MNIISHKQLLSGSQSTGSWLVEGLIRAGSIGFIAGEPKVGKSWLALHVAQCVSTGTPVLGRFHVPHPPKRVLFVEEEDSYETVISRYRLLKEGHRTPEPLEGNLNFLVQSGLKLDDPDSFQELDQQIEDLDEAGHKPDLIIFDVLNKLHGGSDASQRQATCVMQKLECLRRKYECAILIVHHFAKGSENKRGNQRMRGSSVFAGWSENSLYLSRGPGVGVSHENEAICTVRVEVESKFVQVDGFVYLLKSKEGQWVKLDAAFIETYQPKAPTMADLMKLDSPQAVRKAIQKWTAENQK